jgi:hypothetical protein
MISAIWSWADKAWLNTPTGDSVRIPIYADKVSTCGAANHYAMAICSPLPLPLPWLEYMVH